MSDKRKPYQPPKLQRFGNLRRMTQGSGGNRFDGNNSLLRGSGNPRPPRPPRRPRSERRLKKNILHIGNLSIGVGLYLFDYRKPLGAEENGRQLGVMAEEVERVMPEAVTVSADGFKRVDYGVLDIQPGDILAAIAG